MGRESVLTPLTLTIKGGSYLNPITPNYSSERNQGLR